MVDFDHSPPIIGQFTPIFAEQHA